MVIALQEIWVLIAHDDITFSVTTIKNDTRNLITIL